jgi:hypothetical protein
MTAATARLAVHPLRVSLTTSRSGVRIPQRPRTKGKIVSTEVHPLTQREQSERSRVEASRTLSPSTGSNLSVSSNATATGYDDVQGNGC